jgi:hypothetical protein
MRKIEIEVPESIYLKAFEQYGSRKKVEDILSIRLERYIRKNRKLISQVEPERTTTISIYVKDHIYPFFNELLIERNDSKTSFISKMLKRLIK